MPDLDKLIAKASRLLEQNKAKTKTKTKHKPAEPVEPVKKKTQEMEDEWRTQANKLALALAEQNRRLVAECSHLDALLVRLAPLQQSTDFLAHQFAVQNSRLQTGAVLQRSQTDRYLRDAQFIHERSDNLLHWHSWILFFYFLFLFLFAVCSLYAAFSLPSVLTIVALGSLPFVSPLFLIYRFLF